MTTPYDPGAYTVAEVEDYVTANPDQAQAVRDAEAGNRNRVTLLAWLDAQLAPSAAPAAEAAPKAAVVMDNMHLMVDGSGLPDGGGGDPPNITWTVTDLTIAGAAGGDIPIAWTIHNSGSAAPLPDSQFTINDPIEQLNVGFVLHLTSPVVGDFPMNDATSSTQVALPGLTAPTGDTPFTGTLTVPTGTPAGSYASVVNGWNFAQSIFTLGNFNLVVT